MQGEHGKPPSAGEGESHFLVWDMVPSPQRAEHFDQLDHEPQVPLTGS